MRLYIPIRLDLYIYYCRRMLPLVGRLNAEHFDGHAAKSLLVEGVVSHFNCDTGDMMAIVDLHSVDIDSVHQLASPAESFGPLTWDWLTLEEACQPSLAYTAREPSK